MWRSRGFVNCAWITWACIGSVAQFIPGQPCSDLEGNQREPEGGMCFYFDSRDGQHFIRVPSTSPAMDNVAAATTCNPSINNQIISSRPILNPSLGADQWIPR